MTDEEFRERYQRAFSSMHTSENFEVNLEEETMTKNHKRNQWITAVCAALAVILCGTAVYAKDIGGIQRTMQIWLNGNQTTATVDLSEDGTFTISDKDGNQIMQGGGAIEKGLVNYEPATADDILEQISDFVDLSQEDGRYYLIWHDQKIDITDNFNDEGWAYITLKDGDEVEYVTMNKSGGYGASTDRYLEPGKDFDITD